jgi:3'-5' exoribonuclease
MTKLPGIRALTADSTGVGYFLCCHKEVRPGKNGDFISLTLQDATGRIQAKAFDDVDRLKVEFEVGEFVKVKARANLFNGRLQLVVENLRRVNPEQDRATGFREEDCIPSSPRPIEEMWTELCELVGGVKDDAIRELLRRLIDKHQRELRVWPAAQVVHHAYRGGFLEHALQIARAATMLADLYSADRDMVIAGAILHDIGKLQELDYEVVASYSAPGRLVGHITLGVVMVREIARGIDGFPPERLMHLEHLILSHHGSRDLGSPVEPMTMEAFILSMCDDLDAKIHQAKQAMQEVGGEGEFTAYQPRLGRVLWKGRSPDHE